MADDRKRGRRSWLSSKFFLLCLYVAVYAFLRFKGEIVAQQISLPSARGGVEIYRMIGPHPDMPNWRQQLWRAFFSLAMVGEEEGKKFYQDITERKQAAGYPVRQGQYGQQNQYGQQGQYVQQQGQQYMSESEQIWESIKGYIRDMLAGR